MRGFNALTVVIGIQLTREDVINVERSITLHFRVQGEGRMSRKIAIVGSREKHWTSDQRKRVVKEIRKTLFKHMTTFYDGYESVKNRQSVTLVSGACPWGGVDVWAEIVADLDNIPKIIYAPKELNWKSYSHRNMKIAEECNILYNFQPESRPRGGGTWTLEQAENLGKEVYLIIVREEQ